MASRRQNVVRVLLYVADDLEDRHYPMAGVIRQLAREVAQLAFEDPAEAGRCACGAVVVQPRIGRPRKFCTTCSPQRKTRGKRDDASEDTAHQEGTAA